MERERGGEERKRGEGKEWEGERSEMEGEGRERGNSYSVQLQVRKWCYLDEVFGYNPEPGDYLHQCVVAG